MNDTFTTQIERADYERAAAVVRAASPTMPRIGMILGSGLGVVADQLDDAIALPYDAIPGFPPCTVAGHSGRLVIGNLAGVRVIAQQGRHHFYEGYTMAQVTFATRILHLIGVTTLIVTNAAGGINSDFGVGDVMLINDHINFVGMAGFNPLSGSALDFGERFVGMTRTYDAVLRARAKASAAAVGAPLHEGVYACVSGPNFETPAEVRMLRTIGADAVGMSTVHEVLAARQVGMRILGLSGITNTAIDTLDSVTETDHAHVLQASALLVPRISAIVGHLLPTLAADSD